MAAEPIRCFCKKVLRWQKFDRLVGEYEAAGYEKEGAMKMALEDLEPVTAMTKYCCRIRYMTSIRQEDPNALLVVKTSKGEKVVDPEDFGVDVDRSGSRSKREDVTLIGTFGKLERRKEEPEKEKGKDIPVPEKGKEKEEPKPAKRVTPRAVARPIVKARSSDPIDKLFDRYKVAFSKARDEEVAKRGSEAGKTFIADMESAMPQKETEAVLLGVFREELKGVSRVIVARGGLGVDAVLFAGLPGVKEVDVYEDDPFHLTFLERNVAAFGYKVVDKEFWGHYSSRTKELKATDALYIEGGLGEAREVHVGGVPLVTVLKKLKTSKAKGAVIKVNGDYWTSRRHDLEDLGFKQIVGAGAASLNIFAVAKWR